jgi:GNAT superfamily N-acetyltransferase
VGGVCGCSHLGLYASPHRIKRHRPDPVPALLVGRLAIHKGHLQEGIGKALLNEAIRRAMQAAAIAGVTALRVHALSEHARRLVVSRGFIRSPGQPMILCLMRASMEQARVVRGPCLSAVEQLAQHLGMGHGNPQRRLGRACGRAPPLFPVLQRARRDPQQGSELMLRKPAMGASFSRSGRLDLRDPGRLARAHLADGLQQVLLKPLHRGGHPRQATAASSSWLTIAGVHPVCRSGLPFRQTVEHGLYRHQRGTASAMEWNTHLFDCH